MKVGRRKSTGAKRKSIAQTQQTRRNLADIPILIEGMKGAPIIIDSDSDQESIPLINIIEDTKAGEPIASQGTLHRAILIDFNQIEDTKLGTVLRKQQNKTTVHKSNSSIDVSDLERPKKRQSLHTARKSTGGSGIYQGPRRAEREEL
jgi:hypothetical protein